MHRTGLIFFSGILVLAACNGGLGDAGGTATDSDPGPTSTGATTTEADIDTSGISATSTSQDLSSTTDEPSTDSSNSGVSGSSSGSSDDSDTGTCTPGELNCTCNDGACIDDLECIKGTCSMPQSCIDDDFGDNTNEDSAFSLGQITDDDRDGGTVMGILTGPDDADWFRYDGSDEPLGMIDPFRTIVSSAPVRFCKYAECADGDQIDFPCPEDAVATTSPGGRPGCCADSIIHVLDAVCGASSINDDSMTVWISVDSAEDVCVSYAFDYHF